MGGAFPLGAQAAILVAESFSVDAWQRVHLHDLCDGIVLRQLPARRRLCACAKIWALPPGEHRARLMLIDPDGQTLAVGQPTVVQPAEGLSSCTVLTAFAAVTFRAKGRHEVVLELDGRAVAAVPLEVAIGGAEA
jgi:hypothetical protein